MSGSRAGRLFAVGKYSAQLGEIERAVALTRRGLAAFPQFPRLLAVLSELESSSIIIRKNVTYFRARASTSTEFKPFWCMPIVQLQQQGSEKGLSLKHTRISPN